MYAVLTYFRKSEINNLIYKDEMFVCLYETYTNLRF